MSGVKKRQRHKRPSDYCCWAALVRAQSEQLLVDCFQNVFSRHPNMPPMLNR